MNSFDVPTVASSMLTFQLRCIGPKKFNQILGFYPVQAPDHQFLKGCIIEMLTAAQQAGFKVGTVDPHLTIFDLSLIV